MTEDLIFTPADFVAVFNQTLERAYPIVTIEGELSDFRINRGQWVYFDLKDELASVSFFGSVYALPGPLADGLQIRVVARPRLHPRFGFSLVFESIAPVGEGSLKKAADLLRAKLEAEGLFEPARKRPLPAVPETVGLITAANSAAYTDFIKTLNERWGGVEVQLIDCPVQGTSAPAALVEAVDYFNKQAAPPEVLVITRGGGSLEDLAAFNDERLVRAVAASRAPTLVAVGHEIDVSLAELAADLRASTPTNAAALLVPDKTRVVAELQAQVAGLGRQITVEIDQLRQALTSQKQQLDGLVKEQFSRAAHQLERWRQILEALNPEAVLRRGYALVLKNGRFISRVGQVRLGDKLKLRLSDGLIKTRVDEVIKGG